MAKPWRCRLRLHRWQRLRGANGQWYRECRGCGKQRIDITRKAPGPRRCERRARIATPPLPAGPRRPGRRRRHRRLAPTPEEKQPGQQHHSGHADSARSFGRLWRSSPSASGSPAARASRAPSPAKASAVASPIPLEAPVITTTAPRMSRCGPIPPPRFRLRGLAAPGGPTTIPPRRGPPADAGRRRFGPAVPADAITAASSVTTSIPGRRPGRSATAAGGPAAGRPARRCVARAASGRPRPGPGGGRGR